MALLVIIAMCQAGQERAKPVFCPGSPWVVHGDSVPDPRGVWAYGYATDSTEVRSGPAPDDSVLLRPTPGSELRVRFVDGWSRVVGENGELGGWIRAGTLSGPLTRMKLRALSRAHRQALRRELMEGMERDSGTAGIRLHPRGVPDFQRLYASRTDTSSSWLDSAGRDAFTGAPFALYADVEERVDSVRLVMVAATRSARPLTWTRVSMLPDYMAEQDSFWKLQGQPPVQFSAAAGAGQPGYLRFLALPADSVRRERARYITDLDSVELRMHEPECSSAYLVSRADRERLRRALRLYDLSSAERL